MKNTLLAALVVVTTLAPTTAWAGPNPIRLQRDICALLSIPPHNPSVISVTIRNLAASAFGCVI